RRDVTRLVRGLHLIDVVEGSGDGSEKNDEAESAFHECQPLDRYSAARLLRCYNEADGLTKRSTHQIAGRAWAVLRSQCSARSSLSGVSHCSGSAVTNSRQNFCLTSPCSMVESW